MNAVNTYVFFVNVRVQVQIVDAQRSLERIEKGALIYPIGGPDGHARFGRMAGTRRAHDERKLLRNEHLGFHDDAADNGWLAGNDGDAMLHFRRRFDWYNLFVFRFFRMVSVCVFVNIRGIHDNHGTNSVHANANAKSPNHSNTEFIESIGRQKTTLYYHANRPEPYWGRNGTRTRTRHQHSYTDRQTITHTQQPHAIRQQSEPAERMTQSFNGLKCTGRCCDRHSI